MSLMFFWSCSAVFSITPVTGLRQEDAISCSTPQCSWYTHAALATSPIACEDVAICWRTRQRGGGSAMTFEEILDQALAMLQRRGRVTYRTLKRQFNLEDDTLEDLKVEIIKGQRLAVDEDGEVLVWAGGVASPVGPAGELAHAPRTYTPPHLAEKILTSRAALEGERKQVTVLFADLKGSMELLADRDPEEARQLLDPVLERMMAAVHRYE